MMDDVLQKSAENYEARGRLDPATFERNVIFHTYAPPPDLAPFLEHFWTLHWQQIRNAYYSEQVMHRPYVDIFLSAQESGIQGTFRSTRIYVAEGRGRIVGVRFRPGAFHAFWDGRITELQEKVLALQQIFPVADNPFVEQLLTLADQSVIDTLIHLLRARKPQPDSNIEILNEIIAAIESNEELQSVTAVAKAFSRSERWLQQLFQNYTGVGLKWLLQRHRLLTAAERIRQDDEPNWAAIAYDLGYSSQQHFITDFKQVVGKTPTEYRRGVASSST